MNLKNMFKKSVASVLIGALVFTSIGLDKHSVKAASTKTYISDIKLITGELTDAVKSKYKGYKFIEKSLSEGGGGTKVYMAYKTTTDVSDAIRDIAFMQMKGNYSVSAYEKVLEDNMELARQNVEEFKCVVDEFRANYNSKVEGERKLALQAYELLNKYYEEDTGLGMGDFFLNKDGQVKDENYVTLAMQAPSATLTSLMSIVAKACDTDENSTWLDRLVSYNGFDGLAFAEGFNTNNEAGKKMAREKFESEYGDIIQYLTTEVQTSDSGEAECAWDIFAKGLKTYKESLIDNTSGYDEVEEIDSDNPEEIVEQTSEEIEKTIDTQNSVVYGSFYPALVGINYGEGTLADLFMKTSDEMTKEDFYPIIASLTPAQRVVMLRCGFATLFASVGEQFSAEAVTSDNSVLETDEKLLENATGENLEEIQEESAESQVEAVDDAIEEIKDEMPDDIVDEMIVDDKISVYAGVDRSFFDKGIAMTTKASDKDSEQGLDSKKTLPMISYITGSIGIASTIAGATFLMLANSARAAAQYTAFVSDFTPSIMEELIGHWLQQAPTLTNACHCSKAYPLLNSLTHEWNSAASETYNRMMVQYTQIQSKSMNNSAAAAAGYAKSATYKIVGTTMLVLGLALTTFAIVESIISLVKKDDPKYTEIPMKMVDSSNGEKKNLEDFLYYNAVQNESESAQDLNNWTSGTWLAMYVTKTKSAGAPILFNKDKPEETFKIQDNSNNTTGLKSAHLFGETGAYNMLTYSKNAKSQPKLFMYFERDKEGNTGSIFGNTTVLVSLGLVILALGVFVGILISKKRKDENNNK